MSEGTIEDGQLGLRLKSLNRYAYKSDVFEAHTTYVIDDKDVRKRLQRTGYFNVIELDPEEHVLLQRHGKTVAVRDPVTALRMAAVAHAEGEEPSVRKKPRIKRKVKDSEKPKEIQVGERSPEPKEPEEPVKLSRDELLAQLAELDDEAEEELPDDIRDDAPDTNNEDEGVEV